MEKTVEVLIARGGKITAEVHGVHGASCQGDLAWIDKLGDVVNAEPTEDYHRIPDLEQSEQQGQQA